MADQLNVDVVNIRDYELFTSETVLNLMRFPSRRDGLNKKVDGEALAAAIVTVYSLGTFAGTIIPDNTNVKAALQALENAVSAAGSVSTYSAGNGVVVTATVGVTTTKASGVITVILPAGGFIVSGYIDFVVGDAVYTNGTISQGIKVKFDNAANGQLLSKDVSLYTRTTVGTVTAGNPLQYNTALNLSKQVDEFGSSVTGYIFPQVSANAPSGGIIFF